MRRFAQLYQALDASTATGDKLAALQAYFAQAPAADAAWAVYFLAGGKPRQVVPTKLLRETACALAGIDDWLFEACYQAVGDLAETIAHVLPPPTAVDDEQGLAHWVEQRLLPLRGQPPEAQAEALRVAWAQLGTGSRFLLVKLIGGGFRVGVSKLLVQRALAAVSGLDSQQIAQRLMGWTDARATPCAERYQALVNPEAQAQQDAGQPYPFFLAHALADDPAMLGPRQDWLAEWKYDGIRAQVVRRAAQTWIWSRGEELVTERFPEVLAQAHGLPDGTVLDGEILAWRPGEDRPAPFTLLQQRIARKTLPKKLLADAPVRFIAYDLLESEGQDRRAEPQHQRRARLQALWPAERLSPLVEAVDWPALAAARDGSRVRGVEGLMLKHRDAAYGSGRTKTGGVWWKWKTAPLVVDAVLIYAQAGHGRRASLYTDYSFAVWNRTPRDADEAAAVVEAIARRAPPQPDALQLVAFAKAYSGLSDEEFKDVDRVVRANTLEKFGPVRSLRPTLVFELGFEGLNASTRHKSGIAVRFPRMLRIRHDKPLHEADTLASLQALMDR
ncbi:MAG: ATP-dependent DNA ligase [Rubrivivax sp.]|nr:ATP-dependent DNA ligase [Rubrivivax sp.]